MPQWANGTEAELPPILEALQSPDKQYLGDPAYVEALIRSFAADMLQDRMQTQAGADKQAKIGGMMARIKKATDILIGRANDVTPINDGWNSPSGGIVEAVRDSYGIAPDTPDAVMAVPFLYLLQVLADSMRLQADGQDFKHLIDGEIASMIAVFLGYADQAAED